MFYLGTISGSSGACYNTQTGVSGLGTFGTTGIRKLWLVPSASGMGFLLSLATGITNFCTAANYAQIAAPGVLNGPFNVPPGVNPVQVAVYSPVTGGASLFVSCRVFGSSGS